jgi:hypothetical protein
VQIVRFQVDGRTRYGVLDGPVVIECTGTQGVGSLRNPVVRL